VARDEAIGIVLADPSAIRRAGIAALLRRDTGMAVLGEAASADDGCALAARLKPAVCLVHAELVRTDLQWLGRLGAVAPQTAAVVYDAGVAGDRVQALLSAGALRVLLPGTTSAQLLGLLHAVGAPGGHDRSATGTPDGSAPAAQGKAAPSWAADAGARLSEHQRLILSLVIAGHSNREIAAQLTRSEHTVRTHLRRAYRRIGVRNRAQATGWLIANGWYRAELSRPDGLWRRDEG